MIRTVGIGLFAAIVGLGLGVHVAAVHADSKVDCGSASKFDDTKSYKKGDLVWWSSGGSAATEYRCNTGTCKSLSPTTSAWARVSECRSGSAK